MSNPKDTKMTPISALIEVFPLCQKVILNTVDFKDHGFTKTQLCILLSLTAKSPLTMSELATYLASSKEQATRAVAPLVKTGYLERIQDETNRKLDFGTADTLRKRDDANRRGEIKRSDDG
mgnify:CR=1 FL=1